MTNSKAMGALGMMSIRPLENPVTGTHLLEEKVQNSLLSSYVCDAFTDNGVDLLAGGEEGSIHN